MSDKFKLSDSERKFLIDNQDLIKNNNWDLFINRLDNLFWNDDNVDFSGLLQFIYFDCSVDFLQEIPYVPESMFQDCDKLDKFIVPSNIVYVEEFAFYNSSLSEIIIPESVISIYSDAFKECENLKFIDISNIKFENIGPRCFLETNLKEIILDKRLEKSPLRDDVLSRICIDKDKTKIYYQ